MAAKSTLKNMALCLTLVCLFSSGILAAVYAVTYQPILQASQKALQESIGKVLPEGGTVSEARTASFAGQQYEYYVSESEGEPLAYAVTSAVNGFSGTLKLMVGVLPDGTVCNTAVLECNETPGLGAKCQTDEAFISQFCGFNGTPAVKKDGGDIDGITASTITSRAYTKAVRNAVELVKSFNNSHKE